MNAPEALRDYRKQLIESRGNIVAEMKAIKKMPRTTRRVSQAKTSQQEDQVPSCAKRKLERRLL